MSLPIEWVDRIFTKLTLNYGVDFMARYKGMSPADVKTDWAHELGCFGARPAAIRFALESLPDRTPTAQQFKALCLSAPNTEKPIALTNEPKANPEIVAKAMTALTRVSHTPIDSRAWAKSILGNPKGRTPAVIQMARNALGILE